MYLWLHCYVPCVLDRDTGSIIALAISIAVQTHHLPIIQLKSEYVDKMFFCFSAGKVEHSRPKCEIPELKFSRKNLTCLDSQRAVEIVCLPTV